MKNLVLITSIIDPPLLPLSYTETRSVFSVDERFEQTKKTIQSVKEKIPNVEILIVECSNLLPEHEKYFKEHCTHFINLVNDTEMRKRIYGPSKSLGEGMMTMIAIEYLKKIPFDNFFKISGRYWLSEYFQYDDHLNDEIVFHSIDNDSSNISTTLYKQPKHKIEDFYLFLQLNQHDMEQGIAYENLFGRFLQQFVENKRDLPKIGIQGYISVSNEFLNI